ncbi:hypothetical protein OG21DRAFT_1518385 [Imleria badia]|nr:hypothetical protein OG21DRAFT_1518385 [Imleria badia]
MWPGTSYTPLHRPIQHSHISACSFRRRLRARGNSSRLGPTSNGVVNNVDDEDFDSEDEDDIEDIQDEDKPASITLPRPLSIPLRFIHPHLRRGLQRHRQSRGTRRLQGWAQSKTRDDGEDDDVHRVPSWTFSGHGSSTDVHVGAHHINRCADLCYFHDNDW